MKFRIDMPISPKVDTWLLAEGHDSIHVSALGMGNSRDDEIMKMAVNEDRIIITADTDFPFLLALSGQASPGVILFRGGSFTAHEMIGLLNRVLHSVADTLLTRSICVVDRHRIRIRSLPIQ